VLTLAKRLNMLTVAEGVETPEQARWLSERGVNFMQGYWISRPLPLDDFVRWLKETVYAAVVRCAYVPYYS
jgi:EAL domain-containing protein (putative c-di-GMP-specific phosphodiesterase class I)